MFEQLRAFINFLVHESAVANRAAAKCESDKHWSFFLIDVCRLDCILIEKPRYGIKKFIDCISICASSNNYIFEVHHIALVIGQTSLTLPLDIIKV